MPRKLRLEFAGACYHVINRGNYRQSIFGGAGAAESFERCLSEAAVKFGWRVHAYVIMRNHFHLAVETPEPNLSSAMKWLQGTWANRYNRHRGLPGRPFQGRYKALHVEPGHALAQVAHYIHLNPLRARALDESGLAGFRWSSLWWFPRRDRPNWLEPGTVLGESGGLADSKAGWRHYHTYLEVLAEERPAERDQKLGHLSRGWVVGTKEFRKELLRDLSQPADFLQAARRHAGSKGGRQALQADAWGLRLADCARAAQLDPTRLGPRKSDPGKVLLAALMRTVTPVSNRWLAERLAMGTPASVSQFVRRFHLGDKSAVARFETILSKIKT